LVKNHLARSCKNLQDLLLDLAYSSNLQALARSCHLLSLSKSSCRNRFMGNSGNTGKKCLFKSSGTPNPIGATLSSYTIDQNIGSMSNYGSSVVGDETWLATAVAT
jgi:hypothetical protein